MRSDLILSHLKWLFILTQCAYKNSIFISNSFLCQILFCQIYWVKVSPHLPVLSNYFYKNFTFCFQLNSAPAGGRTVFPRLGVGTEPIAGAAVFWYNLHESGDADQDTLHGACPMLHGTKWGKHYILKFLLFWTALHGVFLHHPRLTFPQKLINASPWIPV